MLVLTAQLAVGVSGCTVQRLRAIGVDKRLGHSDSGRVEVVNDTTADVWIRLEEAQERTKINCTIPAHDRYGFDVNAGLFQFEARAGAAPVVEFRERVDPGRIYEWRLGEVRMGATHAR